MNHLLPKFIRLGLALGLCFFLHGCIATRAVGTLFHPSYALENLDEVRAHGSEFQIRYTVSKSGLTSTCYRTVSAGSEPSPATRSMPRRFRESTPVPLRVVSLREGPEPPPPGEIYRAHMKPSENQSIEVWLYFREGPTSRPIETKFSLRGGEVHNTLLEFAWIASCLVTIPFDTVTYPFQLAFVLYYQVGDDH